MKLNRKWLHEDFVDLSHVSDKEYVETLTVFGQKVWTVAIAQLQLDDVINSQNLDQNKVTKIIDRFRCRISIDAEEVTTIIRRRLLAKTDEGVFP